MSVSGKNVTALILATMYQMLLFMEVDYGFAQGSVILCKIQRNLQGVKVI